MTFEEIVNDKYRQGKAEGIAETINYISQLSAKEREDVLKMSPEKFSELLNNIVSD